MDRPIQLSVQGIIDGVKAIRKDKQVVYLEAKVRIETDFESPYYGTDLKVDEITLSLRADSPVNPGDVVSIDIAIINPMGQRFVPALEVSTNEGS